VHACAVAEPVRYVPSLHRPVAPTGGGAALELCGAGAVVALATSGGGARRSNGDGTAATGAATAADTTCSELGGATARVIGVTTAGVGARCRNGSVDGRNRETGRPCGGASNNTAESFFGVGGGGGAPCERAAEATTVSVVRENPMMTNDRATACVMV